MAAAAPAQTAATASQRAGPRWSRPIPLTTRSRAPDSSGNDSSGVSDPSSRIRYRSFIALKLLVGGRGRGAGQGLADLGAGAVQAGTDGADRDAESACDLFVAELFPGEQQQDVPVWLGQ